MPIVLRWSVAAIVIVGATGCDRGAPAPVAASNVIPLIADDVGLDKIGAYGERPSPPPTPNIDVLAATTIIFVIDNGTAHAGVTPPWRSSHAKATLYEAGVNVPLVIAGPGVSAPGSECGALVHVVDLFATVAEIAGIDLGQLSSEDGKPLRIDGLSLMPYLEDSSAESQRDFIYQDLFGPNGFGPYQFERRMVRDERYKLVEFVADGIQEFYDLEGLIDDGPDRIGALSDEQRSAYERLRSALDGFLVDLAPAASGIWLRGRR